MTEYYPKYAVWELTLQCNMHCKHCGSRAGTARTNELTEKECMDIAQQLIDLGNEQITLIGGEVFMVPFWFKVARKFIDNGVSANIITNAYIIQDKQIDELKRSGIRDLGISLDGMENTHNFIRGKPDAFSRAVKAIDRLRQEGFFISVITTLVDANYPELEQMYELLREHGVWAWQLQLASPMGNCSDEKQFLIDPTKLPNIIDFITEKKTNDSSMVIIAGDNIGYYDPRGRDESVDIDYSKEKFIGCAAGLFNIGIDSVGNVKGCESLYSDDFIDGNLREHSLQEIWTREGAFAYNRNFSPSMLSGECANCAVGHVCAAGCRSMSHFSSGDNYNNIYCVRKALF